MLAFVLLGLDTLYYEIYVLLRVIHSLRVRRKKSSRFVLIRSIQNIQEMQTGTEKLLYYF